MLVSSIIPSKCILSFQRYFVGVASGKGALAAGQGLFGALGLLVAAVASLAGSYIYQISGPFLLWLSSGLTMALFVGLAILLGKGHDWRYEINE